MAGELNPRVRRGEARLEREAALGTQAREAALTSSWSVASRFFQRDSSAAFNTKHIIRLHHETNRQDRIDGPVGAVRFPGEGEDEEGSDTTNNRPHPWQATRNVITRTAHHRLSSIVHRLSSASVVSDNPPQMDNNEQRE